MKRQNELMKSEYKKKTLKQQNMLKGLISKIYRYFSEILIKILCVLYELCRMRFLTKESMIYDIFFPISNALGLFPLFMQILLLKVNSQITVRLITIIFSQNK